MSDPTPDSSSASSRKRNKNKNRNKSKIQLQADHQPPLSIESTLATTVMPGDPTANFDLELLGSSLSSDIEPHSHPDQPQRQLTQQQQHNQQPHLQQIHSSADHIRQNLSIENFHLDPHDFQNFLMINPPIMEYSPYYYMKGGSPGPAADANDLTENYGYQHRTSAEADSKAPRGNQFADNFATNLDPAQFDSDVQRQQQEQQPHHQSQQQILQQQSFQPSVPYYSPSRSLPEQAHSLISVPSTPATASVSESARLSNNVAPVSQQAVNYSAPGYPAPPRRRLSISNGQIGQISMIVHRSEAEQEHNMHTLHSQRIQPGQQVPDSVPRVIPPAHQISQQQLNSRAANQGFQPQPTARMHSMHHPQSQPPNHSPLHLVQAKLHRGTPEAIISGEIEVDQDGVPKRQLLYNNEVIFNPDAGPIPGTAAWKRQRILERNRIAASKCRQKKKNLQRRLQENVDELTNKNQYLEEVILAFKERIKGYMDANNVPLDSILGRGNEDFHGNEADSVAVNVKRKRGQKRQNFPITVSTEVLKRIIYSDARDVGLPGAAR